MRKDTKKQILNIVKTIFSAHKDIEKLLKKNSVESAASLIGDCQDAIISVGDIIINSEGEEHLVVGMIENYCRDLYELYNNIGSEIMIRQLNRDLTDIKKGIEKDIVEKQEIVFMPYNASMWDSLESVWKEAEADPLCDVYVVPIPYYYRNPDMSFGEFCYEGDRFPDYVPITHYEKYDLNRKPDKIYIHNPYDQNNRITSVDPRFYSSELKKYTDCLIYIPYFVLQDIDPDNSEAIKPLYDTIVSYGVYNSDKVILQSEKMRQLYINEFYKFAVSNGLTGKYIDRKYLEQKFVGSGSPKYEKLLNTKKEDLDIPDEWKKIIRKPDGSFKKIILYNISVGPFTKYGIKMIEKIKSVLKIFYENKDDVALLWRPHPLLKATIKARCPELLEMYDEIVEKYIEGNWGIFDDSADLDRAIVLSDAYYGDESSVVELYKKIGKEFLIQNPLLRTIENNEFVLLAAREYLIDGDDIWIIPMSIDLLVKYNTVDKNIEIVKLNLPKNLGKIPFSKILKFEEELFLIPENAGIVVIYNILNKTINRLEYDFFKCNSAAFNDAFLYQNYIYCIPWSAEYVVRINTINKMCEKLFNWREVMNISDDNAVLYDSTLTTMNSCFCVSSSSNKLLEINFPENTVIVHSDWNDNKTETYCGITNIEEELFILNNNSNRLIKTDGKKIIQSLICEIGPYLCSNTNGDYFILDDFYSGKVYIYDRYFNIINKHYLHGNVGEFECKFGFVHNYADKEYYYSLSDYRLYIKIKDKIDVHEIFINKKELGNYNFTKESSLFSLYDMINSM